MEAENVQESGTLVVPDRFRGIRALSRLSRKAAPCDELPMSNNGEQCYAARKWRRPPCSCRRQLVSSTPVLFRELYNLLELLFGRFTYTSAMPVEITDERYEIRVERLG